YDSQDRLTSYGSTTYSYTSDGTLERKTDSASGEATDYRYSSSGDLLGVTLPDGRNVEYVVDGLGRRVAKKIGGAFVQGFLYGDAQGPVAQVDSNGTTVARFVYGTSQIVPDYMVKGGTTYRIVTDERGSVREVVDADTGAVAQQMDYDEFGRVTSDTNPGFQPFGFAGGLYDTDTKLTRFGHRDYD